MWWLMLILLLVPFVALIGYAFRPNPPDHQACLKRIYEMEQAMPEIGGIPWVYQQIWSPEFTNEHGFKQRVRDPKFLSWEDFPLKVYEAKHSSHVIVGGVKPTVYAPFGAYKPNATLQAMEQVAVMHGFCVQHQTFFSNRHPYHEQML